ncbi:MAG: MFS transporter [Chloroflexi bacterium]|nr:MFS transporter [Chloroflexota bacterium]
MSACRVPGKVNIDTEVKLHSQASWPARSEKSYARWLVLALGIAIIVAAVGPRMSYSVFIEPVSAEMGWTRTSAVLPFAVLVLGWGLLQPVIGRLIDFYGPRAVIIISLAVAGFAFAATSQITQLWQMVLLLGVIYAPAAAGSGPISLNVLIAPWFGERHRAKVFAAISGFLPISVFVIAPLSFWAINNWGWRQAFIGLGVLFLATVPLAFFGLRERHRPDSQPGTREWSGFLGQLWQDAARAFRLPPFRYLSLAYFTCGFTAIFFMGQLAVVATAYGFTPALGATAVAVSGIVAGAGTLLCGVLADRYSRTIVLAIVYALRGLGFVLLLTVGALSPAAFMTAVVVSAFPLFATDPPTNALIYGLFQRQGVGLRLGLAFSLHHIGGFMGMLIGGLLFDMVANYAIMLWIGAGLMFFATAMSLRARQALKGHPGA